jgi:hypothetical protein
MDGTVRGRLRPRGSRNFDVLMLSLSMAAVLWIVIGH